MGAALTLGMHLPAGATAARALDRSCGGEADAFRDLPGMTGEPLGDAELIRRVARGDRSAFEELHRRYARSVLGIALRRIGDRGRAEDATQDTFASVWRSARRYDPARGAPASWLYTVARNAIVDGLRRTPPPTVAEPPELASTSAGPDELAEAEWTAWRVHRALETLPDEERRLVELAYWSGMSQSEIAGFVNLPLGTVKTRTRSALRRLADELEEELA